MIKISLMLAMGYLFEGLDLSSARLPTQSSRMMQPFGFAGPTIPTINTVKAGSCNVEAESQRLNTANTTVRY
jgi:hypothetical protein